MPTPALHLICNAHLDPVWLWEWEEGAAETLSTFRCAADFCDEFGGFVFNHNEAVLYRWVQEYEPSLFRRIKALVKAGKWHVMGGWWLQPDCNLPAGESLVRQILHGKRWFREHLGVEPRTAMNVDPFGHSRGLVQILAKSGHDSYLFCRPLTSDQVLPGQDFRWVGYDGSEILGHRVLEWYNSRLGGAAEKVDRWLADRREHHDKDQTGGMLLWGVGNHGGGPSRKDLRDLAELQSRTKDWRVLHSTPEAYFATVAKRRATLPTHARDLNPWGVGCYTSQIRIKQLHRKLENELYATEQMAAAASFLGRMAYPTEELRRAQEDLLFSEFHDILPGSSIQRVEDTSIRLLDHGLEELSRAKARAFFALAQGQVKAVEGRIPVLVYNPHPHPVETDVVVEFQLQDQNWADTFTQITAYAGTKALPTQVEKEASNLTLDWRKRVVFRALLAPSTMNRFDCRLATLPAKPAVGAALRLKTNAIDVAVDPQTGLLAHWKVGGKAMAKPGVGAALVIRDNEDPWGMGVHRFRDVEGTFALLSPTDAAIFAGVRAAELAPVRVVEDGAVRTVVEALFGYKTSRLQLRWLLPKHGTTIGLEVRVLWNEKDRMLKLSVPSALKGSRLRGQVAYGTDDLPSTGDEAVAQQWVAVTDDRHAITVINDGTYGCDFAPDAQGSGELRLNLLRSPAYSAHPIGERPLVPQDRLTPRIDQGERQFRFWFDAGVAPAQLADIDRRALAINRQPMALSFFPAGGGTPSTPGFLLSDDVCLLTAVKRAEESSDTVLRLFNPTATKRATTLRIPARKLSAKLTLLPFEIRTLRLGRGGKLVACDLLEKPVKA